MNELLDQMKAIVDERYAKGLEALDSLANFLGADWSTGAASDEPAPVQSTRKAAKKGGSTTKKKSEKASNRDLVATAITRKWLTVDAIREATGLSKAQVRAALVSKSLKDVVERRDGKDGKEYRVG